MDKLSPFIDNTACIGRHFTAWLVDLEKPGEDSIRDVYGNAGQILYMHGESVMVTGINEQQKLISMRNEQNTEGYEAFEIPFFQFTKDFGMWPPEDI